MNPWPNWAEKSVDFGEPRGLHNDFMLIHNDAFSSNILFATYSWSIDTNDLHGPICLIVQMFLFSRTHVFGGIERKVREKTSPL